MSGTTDALQGVIRTALADADHPLAGKIATAIEGRFDVRERIPAAASQPAPTPEVGQLWRNKQSDRLVKISAVDVGYNRAIRWEAITGRGPKTGRVWLHYWTSRYEFIAVAAESDADPEASVTDAQRELDARSRFVHALLLEHGYEVPLIELILAEQNWEALNAPLRRAERSGERVQGLP